MRAVVYVFGLLAGCLIFTALLWVLLAAAGFGREPRMERAVASVYNVRTGQAPACGWKYVGRQTVAHRSLPCGTRLRMCSRRCSTVVVGDRGPFVAGREFDLTFEAQRAIRAPYGLPVVRWRRAARDDR